MEILIRGDKVKVTDAMKEYVEEKLGKLNKYLNSSDEVRATVMVKVKPHQQIVEITIPLKTFILRSEESQTDFYAAVDITIDKLERQIRKNKTRLTKLIKPTQDFNLGDVEEEDDDNQFKIKKRKTVSIKPMSEEEAIIQMELLGHQFYMYKDQETNEPAVVYKRNDNDYGVIESK